MWRVGSADGENIPKFQEVAGELCETLKASDEVMCLFVRDSKVFGRRQDVSGSVPLRQCWTAKFQRNRQGKG